MSNAIEEKQQKINRWLRYHTDYQVTIDLYGIYGCIEIQVAQNGTTLFSSHGNTLEKRLDEAIKYIDGLEETNNE